MNRALNAFEYVGRLVDQAVSQNFVMVARISKTIKESILRQALDILQQRHPPLKCKYKNSDPPEYTSEGVPKIPLHIIERKDDKHWIEVAEKETQEQFPWTIGPLTRVVLLESKDKCDLLVAFCHIIADATAGVKVVKEVLTYADKLSRGETVTPGPPLPELPSTHDMIRTDLKFPPEFLDISGRIMRAFHKPMEMKGDQDAPPEKRITKVIQKILTPEETKELAARCKKEKNSVHSVLCAATLQTIVEQIRRSNEVKARKKGPLMIGCISPVNIRHLLSHQVGDDIGNFISDAFHYQLIDDKSSLWTAARKVKKSIQKEIKYGRDIKAVRDVGDLLEICSTPLDAFSYVYKMVPPTGVTNMGRLDIPEQFGDIRLEELHFTVSINPAIKNGFGLAVTTFRGRMIINFLYSAPYLSKERANAMVENTMKRLKEAIRE